jgi:hypothetical protein
MLTQPQRIQISGEQLDIPLKVQAALDTQAQLAGVKADLLAKDGSVKIFFDKFNGIVDAYQTERRWIDGTTYSTVVESDVTDAAQRKPGNKFLPTDGSWIQFQPKLHNSALGNPTTTSPDYELEIFSKPIEDDGLTVLLDFILNGQISGVADDTLAVDYIPGSGTMEVTTGGQTIGKLIIVEGGGFSGLFLVTDVTTVTTLTVTEIVAPDGTLPMTSSNVEENITAFTNTERNTLVSTLFQNVLTGITNKVAPIVIMWETAINNQLAQLNLNVDNRSPQASEISAAIADINNAKSIIDVWQALPNTGTLGNDSKFVDVQLGALQSEVVARTSFSSTRNTQVTTALGTVNQAIDGTFTGSGIYHERFKQIDLRINAAGGPLTEYYEKNMADSALSQIVTTAINTQTTYETELRSEPLDANADGTNTILVASVTGFSVSDTVFIVSDTQSEITGTITGISGLNITLSITVSNLYLKAERARIYKQL